MISTKIIIAFFEAYCVILWKEIFAATIKIKEKITRYRIEDPSLLSEGRKFANFFNKAWHNFQWNKDIRCKYHEEQYSKQSYRTGFGIFEDR